MRAQGFEMIACRQMDKIDLGKIMILGRQPEDRDCTCFLCQKDDRQRFEQRECRPAKKGNLLSGNNDWSAIFQALNVFQCFFASAEFTILAFEDRSNLPAAFLRNLDSLLLLLEPL